MTIGEINAIITFLDKCGKKVNIRNIRKIARAIDASVTMDVEETEYLNEKIKWYQEFKKEELEIQREDELDWARLEGHACDEI